MVSADSGKLSNLTSVMFSLVVLLMAFFWPSANELEGPLTACVPAGMFAAAGGAASCVPPRLLFLPPPGISSSRCGVNGRGEDAKVVRLYDLQARLGNARGLDLQRGSI